MIKDRGNTMAFSHTNAPPFYAAPHARIAEGCPVHTAFLYQSCLDGGRTPKLLVFDIMEACDDVKA